jgi:Lysyl-tRNA synthetase (class II)
MERQLSEQEQFRRQALADLRAIGLDPYPAAEVPVTHLAEGILNGYPSNPEAFTEVCVAGRLMAKRIMGKASFASIQDSSGRIQAYVNRDEVCPGEDKSLYNDVFKKHLDLGDFVAIYGHVFTTQNGRNQRACQAHSAA